jgi:sugar O-acyltransferase (sialic acid O-acetyltransferase NeuD family)
VNTDINRLLYIIGASGHGKVIADLAESLGYTVYFYDDAYPEKKQIEHWAVLGTFDDLLQLEQDKINVAVAIGNNVIRQEKMLLCEKHHFQLPRLIHLSALISQYAQVGAGTVVLAGAVVNAFARIGRGCIINTASVVEHDCIINDFVHISPNSALAGSVSIGECSWVGIGSQINQLVNIGEHVLIGAGSTVVKNIPANVVAFGSPAKVISHNC